MKHRRAHARKKKSGAIRRVRFSINPRHKARKSPRRHRAFRRNPRRRGRVHFRRNPAGLSTKGLMRQAMPALIGGAGAVAVDVALSYVPGIPDDWKTGWKGYGLKAVAAVGLGYAVGKVMGRENGHLVTMGGLVVVAYSAIANALKSAAPAVAAKAATVSGMSDYTDYGMGAYMPRRPASLGYVSPAPVLQNTGAYMPPSNVGAYMQRNFASMTDAASMGNWGDGM